MKPAKNNSATPKTAVKNVTVPAAKPVRKLAAVSKPLRKPPAVSPLPPPASPSENDITHVEIATRAYFIYVSEGCPRGREMQHWLDAEAQLRGR
jgi:hypothetical protein